LLGDEPSPVQGWIGQPFQVNALAQVVTAELNVRSSADYLGQPAQQVLATVAKGTLLPLTSAPRLADELVWCGVSAVTSTNQPVRGWVAMAGPDGVRFLAPQPVANAIRIGKHSQATMTSPWVGVHGPITTPSLNTMASL